MVKKETKELITDLKKEGLNPEPVTTVGVATKAAKKVLYKKVKPGRRVSFSRQLPKDNLSREQGMLRSFFGGGSRVWGTGQSLPKITNTLTSGGGLIKSGDQGETAGLFGLRRRRLK